MLKGAFSGPASTEAGRRAGHGQRWTRLWQRTRIISETGASPWQCEEGPGARLRKRSLIGASNCLATDTITGVQKTCGPKHAVSSCKTRWPTRHLTRRMAGRYAVGFHCAPRICRRRRARRGALPLPWSIPMTGAQFPARKHQNDRSEREQLCDHGRVRDDDAGPRWRGALGFPDGLRGTLRCAAQCSRQAVDAVPRSPGC